MVVNFVVIASSEEEGVINVVAFPALLPAKKTADKLSREAGTYDVVVWDIAKNEPAYAPNNDPADEDPPK